METKESIRETAQKLGLLPEEFDQIVHLLGRIPNFTELSMFSVMWSEHCCYKNSLLWLKTLPKEGAHILAAAGEENAGLVDIRDGLACAFKIESHNHPSAIEPYQGAATGVGGIHRDIFTMGARPIAALNSLRFGEIQLEKTKALVKGIVKGIGDYGNSFGVATVGGEVYFDKSYNINPLVNAMSVGIVELGNTVSAIATGAGNPVYIVGSSTGKDGIHGATFASEDISASSSEKLPSVQVGDPFQEKLLLEATLEAINTGCVVGMQDMGAAGITCSTAEMSAKGRAGMNIYLDKVPTRQEDLQPFEILLSESQERMLVIVKKGCENRIEDIFEKWDLNCAIIGEVTDEPRLRYFMHGEMVAEIDPDHLALGGNTPVYERAYREPTYQKDIRSFSKDEIPVPEDLKAVARFLIGHQNIASKSWVFEQYDSMVRTNSQNTNAPSDAALVRIKGTERSLAMTVDCNSYYIHADPEQGTAIAVAEAARNITCSGGTPLAITNCLNFGNPMNPEVYWQFVGAIKGMGAACRKFGTPVTGGNVSFYNQSADGGAVLPTPTIGMIGTLPSQDMRMGLSFQSAGDAIYLLGREPEDIASSQYLIQFHNVRLSPAPSFNLEEEFNLHEAVRELIRQGLIISAHDVSEGGLFTCLAESGFPRKLGFQISSAENMRKDACLFGEAQGRIVVSTSEAQENSLENLMGNLNIPFRKIGTVTEANISVDETEFGRIMEYFTLYNEALRLKLES
ncbi:MAG: phosphoribosylformylglycinamidine synthase subunit PurL [Bacteroidia bacterium]